MQLTPVNAVNCQPLKPVNTAVPLRENIAFKNSAPANVAEKIPANFDALQKELALRMLAYTQLKYAELQKTGSCIV